MSNFSSAVSPALKRKKGFLRQKQIEAIVEETEEDALKTESNMSRLEDEDLGLIKEEIKEEDEKLLEKFIPQNEQDRKQTTKEK